MQILHGAKYLSMQPKDNLQFFKNNKKMHLTMEILYHEHIHTPLLST